MPEDDYYCKDCELEWSSPIYPEIKTCPQCDSKNIKKTTIVKVVLTACESDRD